eukprot:m.8340 g.8340  ORF g.8340 m.8340 type:complete len:531 (+) comp6290_c0_seq1:431-2023(+)
MTNRNGGMRLWKRTHLGLPPAGYIVVACTLLWSISDSVVAQSVEERVTQKLGTETKLNTAVADTENSQELQFSPAVAAINSDTFIVTWTSYRPAAIMAKVVRAARNGSVTHTFDEVQISVREFSPNGAWHPAVAVLSPNRTYIAWQHHTSPSTREDRIDGRVVEINASGHITFPSPGVHQVSVFTATTTTRKYVIHPQSVSITAVGRTAIVATWDAVIGTSKRVMARAVQIHPNGQVSLPQPPFIVYSDAAILARPYVVSVDSISILVAWDRSETLNGVGVHNVYGQRYGIDASGDAIAQGGTFGVSTNDDVAVANSANNTGVTIATLSADRVVAAWIRNDIDANLSEIWTRVIDLTDTPPTAGSSLLVATVPITASWDQLAPLVALGPNGFMISWSEATMPGPPNRAFGQVVYVNASGEQSLAQDALNISALLTVGWDTTLASYNGTRMFAAWTVTEVVSGAATFNIYGQVYDINLTAAGFEETALDTPDDADSSSSTTTWIIVGVVAGVAVLILVVVGVMCVQRRERT